MNHFGLKPLSAATISELLSLGVFEGLTVEYKRELPDLEKDTGKQEFAADVSAMANSSGGMILYGVDEDPDGKPVLVGIPGDDLTLPLRQMQQILDSWIEPKLTGPTLEPVMLPSGQRVVGIRVDRSSIGPHFVVGSKASFRVYERRSNLKTPCGQPEIRSMFLHGNEVAEQIRRWRSDRLELLKADSGPVQLGESKLMAIHVVPADRPIDHRRISMADFSSDAIRESFKRGTSHNHCFNSDGFVWYHDKGHVQLFRSGCVEIVDAWARRDGDLVILIEYVESRVLAAVRDARECLSRVGVVAPLAISLELLNVRGATAVSDGAHRYSAARALSMRVNHLSVPGVVINPEEVIEPKWVTRMLEPIWNLAGFRSGLPAGG